MAKSIEVLSSVKREDGLFDEVWLMKYEKPKWWNDDCHCLIETPTHLGMALAKYCDFCEERISDQGCVHNLTESSQIT